MNAFIWIPIWCLLAELFNLAVARLVRVRR